MLIDNKNGSRSSSSSSIVNLQQKCWTFRMFVFRQINAWYSQQPFIGIVFHCTCDIIEVLKYGYMRSYVAIHLKRFDWFTFNISETRGWCVVYLLISLQVYNTRKSWSSPLFRISDEYIDGQLFVEHRFTIRPFNITKVCELVLNIYIYI